MEGPPWIWGNQPTRVTFKLNPHSYWRDWSADFIFSHQLQQRIQRGSILPFVKNFEIYGKCSAVPLSLIRHHMLFASMNQVKPRKDKTKKANGTIRMKNQIDHRKNLDGYQKITSYAFWSFLKASAAFSFPIFLSGWTNIAW